jgi:hypothetical protein
MKTEIPLEDVKKLENDTANGNVPSPYIADEC